MANVIVTLKIMPESPDVDLDKVTQEATVKIKAYAGDRDVNAEQEPLAFGLKSLKLVFLLAEDKGSTDDLEEDIKSIEGVQSVEAVDVRRALG